MKNCAFCQKPVTPCASAQENLAADGQAKQITLLGRVIYICPDCLRAADASRQAQSAVSEPDQAEDSSAFSNSPQWLQLAENREADGLSGGRMVLPVFLEDDPQDPNEE